MQSSGADDCGPARRRKKPARNLWEAELRARADGDGLDVDRVARAWTQGRGSGCAIS